MIDVQGIPWLEHVTGKMEREWIMSGILPHGLLEPLSRPRGISFTSEPVCLTNSKRLDDEVVGTFHAHNGTSGRAVVIMLHQ